MLSSRQTKVTRRDVARHAGVSVTTVTHALNETPGTRVNAETVAKVKKAAKELGYRLNFVGRALVTGRSFTVGLLQPSHESMFLSYYQHLIYGMVQAMEEEDYNLITLFRSDDYRYLKLIHQGRVDGMLILQSDFGMDDIEKIRETEIPAVVVNKDIETQSAPSSMGNIHSDHHQLMNDVVNELVGLGCKRIMAYHDHRSCEVNSQMFHEFTKIMDQHIQDGIIGTTIIPCLDSVRLHIRNLFASGQVWDGIFVDGPHLGEIILDEAKKIGLEHGKDFFLITSSCMDGDVSRSRQEVSAYTHQPEKVGRHAWELLWQIINDDQERSNKELVPYRRYPVNNQITPGR